MIQALRHGARRAMLTATASVIALTFAVPAHAGGSSMPWEAPLQSILESIEGPVAKIVAVIIIIVTGLTLAFGDTSGGFRRLIQIVFGLSIAFAASSFTATGGTITGGPTPSPSAPTAQPAWAARIKNRQSAAHGATVLAHTMKAGDSQGGGAGPDVKERE